MTAVLCAAVALVGACETGRDTPIVRRDEIVVGRAREDGAIWLLTDTKRLIRVSVSGGTSGAFGVKGLRGSDALWGLARTDRGALVTMVSPSTLAEIGPTGVVGRRWSTNRQYLGIHSLSGGVLLQPATLKAGSHVLVWTRHPGSARQAVPALQVTSFDARAETLARNLIGCGITRTRQAPCWFNHDPRVHRIGVEETSSVVELGEPWSGEGSRGDRPLEERGPVIDAQIAGNDALWVLLRRAIDEGLTLMCVSADGLQTFRRTLDTDVRLILDVNAARVLLLSREGFPVEVGLG